MTVTIKYMAQVKMAAGVASEQVELDQPCTAIDLVQQRAQQGGEALRRALLRDGRLQPTILLFVGDQQVDPASPRPLQDGDLVTVLAPMAGG